MTTPQLLRKELTVTQVKQETPTIISIAIAIGGIHFEYHAGQYVGVTLDVAQPDEKGNVRAFSLASSPTEKGKLMIAARERKSTFKQAFFGLKPGDKVKVSGPFGRLALHENYHREAVMLCGGIGITPLRSMIMYATDGKLPLKITLFYSNRTPEEIAFKSELDELQRRNKNLSVIYMVTRPEEAALPWDGKVGRIDSELVKEYVADMKEAIFYVCGPPAMVKEMLEMLSVFSIPVERIRFENFTGYG